MSTGQAVRAAPSPSSVVAASNFGVNVSAARPGQVAVTIEVAYRPPTDHVPEGWTLAASGTFTAATLLRVETPDGVSHDEFVDLGQIILPSEITYRMFRRFRDDTGLEQHLFELTPAMMLDPTGRPARVDTTEHVEPDPDDTTRWEVACPTATLGTSVMVNGQGADRTKALRALVDTGLDLLQRQSPDAGPLSSVFVLLGAEFAWVRGFGDPTLSRSDLERVILDAIEGERRTAVERAAASATRASRPPVKHATQPSSVTRHWNRIAGWFETTLPKVVISGADASRVADAESRSGVAWPSELVELFRCVDGLPREPWMALFPLYELFDLDAMLDERERMTSIWQTGDAENDPDRTIAPTAGEAAWTFLDEFLPIAGMDGYFLFVDTRAGEMNGCVTSFDKVDSDDAGPQWLSVSALLDDLATSLETGEPFDGGWRPTVVEGRLQWHC